MSKPPVLVVGAGPVGLTAANSLARFGVPVRIIDSRATPTQLSKALAIWRRSLHTLDPMIPSEQWINPGKKAGGINLADSGSIFASVSMEPPAATGDATAPQQHMLPPGLLITQAQIEAGLEQHLQDKYDIRVQRSTALESFSVDEAAGGVRCVLVPAASDDPTGSTSTSTSTSAEREEVLVSHLIGCDGARSAVRKGLGIPFPGYSDPDTRFLMVDCTYEYQPGINSNSPRSEAEGRPDPCRPMASTSAVGLILSIPLVDTPDAIRLVWDAGRAGPAQPSLADFQAVLLQHTRLQLKLKEALWLSEFAVNERQVESYVHYGGRVLLAGDAAHVHSPAGGQGMNTGIQDATNLAWKVALAAAGDVTGPELLQTYQEERHPVGAAAVRFSGGLLRANAIRNPLLRFLRRVGLGILTRIPPVKQMFVAAIVEDTVSYTSSSLAKLPAAQPPAACAGTAFPDISIMVDGVMRPATDLLRGGDGCFGTLVLLEPPAGAAEGRAGRAAEGRAGLQAGNSSGDDDGADASSSKVAAAWPATWGHWPLHVVSVTRGPATSSGNGSGGGPAGAVDAWGLLAECAGGADGVLVRPDGIIAAAGGPQDVAAWLKAHC